ncbi:MAG: flavodoxin family protein [Aquirhabdus sp.]
MSNELNTQERIQSHSPTKRMCVVYHSAYGHTARVAQAIVDGANGVANIDATLISVEHMDHYKWELLDQSDVLVFGSPTYMGSVTGQFKLFMDATSSRWIARSWSGKLAAGFANSGGLSGDKLAALQQICLFAMQHGMVWSGLPLMSEGHETNDLNRLASFLGLMTQSDNLPVAETPPDGDIQTAHWFGQHLAQLTQRMQ